MPAEIRDVQTLIEAGIDPRTGLPARLGTGNKCMLKENNKKLLRLVDEQQAINRYKWFNLPDTLDSELLERILYYKYKGMFFYMPQNTTFYFLPYTLEGEIDVYGRYTGVTPLPFNGQNKDGEGKEKPWIVGLKRKPIYGIKIDELTMSDIEDSCVLLCDYSKQISQTDMPRQMLNDSLLDVEAEMIPFMRTALLNQTGTSGVRVNNPDEQANVAALNNQVEDAALHGKRYLATIGAVEFQELAQGALGASADFMQAQESIDNFRLSTMGISNGGIFAKKAHMLEAEQAQAGGPTGFVLNDGLMQRQRFCDIVNSIWGLGIWCELSENCTGDVNMDGVVADTQDQSGIPGEQPQGVMENE